MEWLLPSLNNAKLLQSLNSSSFGSSAASSTASDLPPPPSLSMEPEERLNNDNNNIITLDDESDEDDDGPPMLDRAVPVVAPPKRSSSIINVPVSKEQFSIIEAHKDDKPQTLLEALQKFNESRRQPSSASASALLSTLPTTPLSSLAGSSNQFINNSNPATAAALTRLLPALLKKPVTPLAALPKKTAPTIPVFSFKKPIVLRPKSSATNSSSATSSTVSTSSNPSNYSTTLPSSTSTTSESNPSFSISIKETMNPLLESLIAAASKKQSPKSLEANEKPPILTDFSDDVGEKCDSEKSK
uniref:Uncharacterized protein n=1 Tax=Panagrolaimus sp. ES5 TaxID=591445 RepID=A0AC34F564_9BILA